MTSFRAILWPRVTQANSEVTQGLIRKFVGSFSGETKRKVSAIEKEMIYLISTMKNNCILEDDNGNPSLPILKKLVTLQEGSGFGELALVDSESLRMASCKTVGECWLATLNRDAYNAVLRRSEIRSRAQKTEFLKTFPLFNELSQLKLGRTLNLLELRKPLKGVKLYKEGDTPDGIYLIKKGVITYYKSNNVYKPSVSTRSWLNPYMVINAKGF